MSETKSHPQMYYCLYVLFYRGPLGRLANLAKSETLLKYCINKYRNASEDNGILFCYHLYLCETTEDIHDNLKR